jgi:hypothetical protein
MWGLSFRFAKAPVVVARFKRSGRTLAATGRGRIRIHRGRACRFSAKLPFERRLPPACLRAS